MKKQRLTVLLALATMVVMQACNSSDKKSANNTSDGVMLAFNLQKGKTYTYEMDMDMDSEVQGQKLDNKMAFRYTMQVLNDQDSVRTLRTTYDHIKMNMNAGPMNIAVDTDEPQKEASADLQRNPTAIMSNMFHAMKGKSFDMKVNSRGEVVSVTGLNELMSAMMNSLPAADENARQTMAQAFQSQFNEEAIKKTFSQSFNIFPAKPVKEGETWTKTINVGGPDMITVYKVKDINGNNVVLDLNSEMNANGNKGVQTGTMKVNAQTGLVTEATLDNTFSSAGGTTKTKTTIKGQEQ
jgi:hypothetical protein